MGGCFCNSWQLYFLFGLTFYSSFPFFFVLTSADFNFHCLFFYSVSSFPTGVFCLCGIRASSRVHWTGPLILAFSVSRPKATVVLFSSWWPSLDSSQDYFIESHRFLDQGFCSFHSPQFMQHPGTCVDT